MRTTQNPLRVVEITVGAANGVSRVAVANARWRSTRKEDAAKASASAL